MSEMLIRPAWASDAKQIAGINRRAWQSAYRGVFPPSFLDNLDVSIERWLERIELGTVLVSSVDGRLAGYTGRGEAEDHGWGEVKAIYVDPGFQRTGHGTALLDATISTLAGEGFKQLLLWVIDANWVARSFYENRGWTLAKPFRIEEIAGTQVTLVRYERKVRKVRPAVAGAPQEVGARGY